MDVDLVELARCSTCDAHSLDPGRMVYVKIL